MCKRQEFYDLIKESCMVVERNSVAYRFGIAILQKMSYVQLYAKAMINDKILDWAKEEFMRYRSGEHN